LAFDTKAAVNGAALTFAPPHHLLLPDTISGQFSPHKPCRQQNDADGEQPGINQPALRLGRSIERFQGNRGWIVAILVAGYNRCAA
jgi:hypothetical protein